jgi:hypothetical protein
MPRARSSPTGPVCPDPVWRQQFWKPWQTRTWTWTRTRTWPRPARIYCGPCTPSHDYCGREDTRISGNTPGNRRWILCTPTPRVCPSPPIFKPHKEVCQLECMLFLWVRRGQWPHQPEVPPTSEEARSQQILHTTKCPAIRRCGVWMQHKNSPQDGVSNNVTVRGN